MIDRVEHAGGAPDTTLAAPLAQDALSFTVTDGGGYPTGDVGDYFYVILDRGTSSEEVVKCEARSANTFTVLAGGRGASGTSATAHQAGRPVTHGVTAQEIDDLNAGVVDALKGSPFWAGQHLTAVPVSTGAATNAGGWTVTVPAGAALVTVTANVICTNAGGHGVSMGLTVAGVHTLGPEMNLVTTGTASGLYSAQFPLTFTAGSKALSVRYACSTGAGGVSFEDTTIAAVFGRAL